MGEYAMTINWRMRILSAKRIITNNQKLSGSSFIDLSGNGA